jgi:DNA-binding transcriptional ArsR family regulator
LSENKSKTTSKSIKETRQYHERYLRAVNNPLRRKILRALKESPASIESLRSKTGLDDDTLRWHLNVLESGACVEKNEKQGKLTYKLTQEGRVIDYME